jgi:hypothetical protein
VLGEDARRPAHLRGLLGLIPAEPHTEVADRRGVVVGLDVHKSSVRLAALRDGELVRDVTFGYDHEQLLGEVRVWPGARVCQEARPTGFGCHRALVAAGVDSVILAPGLVPSRPGDRVKTDKRDARRLAGPHAAGPLTEIFIPTPEHEALRDLLRAREDARLDAARGSAMSSRAVNAARTPGLRACVVLPAATASRVGKIAGRGEPHQKVVVACARELAGFVWAIASEKPLRTR